MHRVDGGSRPITPADAFGGKAVVHDVGIGKLLAGTKDPQFVTARHTLQALWHVGLVGKKQQAKVVTGLSARFRECAEEKNGTLIRYDIVQGLRRIHDATKDEGIRKRALALIATEEDPKYRRKYTTLLR